MAKVWIYFFIMLWISYLVGSGIHLFSKGFLLSRRVQTEHNECVRLKMCDGTGDEVIVFINQQYKLIKHFDQNIGM